MFVLGPSCACHVLAVIGFSIWPPSAILDFDIWSLLPLFLGNYWRDLYETLWTCSLWDWVVHAPFWAWSDIKDGRWPPSCILSISSLLEIVTAISRKQLKGYWQNLVDMFVLRPSCACHILTLIGCSIWPPGAILDFDIQSLLLVFLENYWSDRHETVWTCSLWNLVVHAAFWAWSHNKDGHWQPFCILSISSLLEIVTAIS